MKKTLFERVLEEFETAIDEDTLTLKRPSERSFAKPEPQQPQAPQQDPSQRPVSASELKQLEQYLDALYARNKIDFEFTRHFLDRVNDPRNGKQITIGELARMFTKAQQQYGSMFAKSGDIEATLRDVNTMINSPFALEYMRNKGKIEMRPITVMRKRNFHARAGDPVYTVEDEQVDEAIYGETFFKALQAYLDAKKRNANPGSLLLHRVANIYGLRPRELQNYILQKAPESL